MVILHLKFRRNGCVIYKLGYVTGGSTGRTSCGVPSAAMVLLLGPEGLQMR